MHSFNPTYAVVSHLFDCNETTQRVITYMLLVEAFATRIKILISKTCTWSLAHHHLIYGSLAVVLQPDRKSIHIRRILFWAEVTLPVSGSLTAIWSVLFSSLYDELCWWYLFQTQYAVSTMITFYTYRVVVANSVRTVLQGTNRTRRPKRTASAFAVTKNFRTSVPIYYFAPQKMRHKPASTKNLELCARSIPQLWGYQITTRMLNHHVQIPHSAAAAVTAIVESYR